MRGETPHFDYVAGEAARGLQRVALETGVPVAFGVLTTDTWEQAEARAGGAAGNKGFDAAEPASLGLLPSVGGEDAEDDRDACFESDALQSASRFARHVIEMRRIAAHHGAQRDNCVKAAAPRELHRRERKFEGSRNIEHLMALRSRFLQSLAGAIQKLLGDGIVEARHDDREVSPRASNSCQVGESADIVG